MKIYHIYINGNIIGISAQKVRVDSSGNLIFYDNKNNTIVIIANGCWDGVELAIDQLEENKQVENA